MATTHIGTFSALGGDIIGRVDIEPSIGELQAELLEIAGNVENTGVAMLAARRIAKDDLQARFDSQTGPDLDRWIDLDDDYAREKESLGYPSDILNRTGDLERAATSDAAFIITNDMLYYNLDVLPKTPQGYNLGLIHQLGTDSLGNVSKQKATDTTLEHTSRLTIGVGPGHALPARPFIGLSEDAEAEVWEVFDKWFAEATSLNTAPIMHSSGWAQARSSGGQFARRIL